ncbi:MAG: peptide chain release factor N(5)-glutamine methyltransferase, partial [Chitinophagales bacterium]|nr:peptide chain release factor N(5)-glutamine methyltransferase [Chitinophagales bacterium]
IKLCSKVRWYYLKNIILSFKISPNACSSTNLINTFWKKAWFYDLEFYVNSNVLIPRPETEELVALIIEQNKAQHLQVLDIGTGSGCIAVTLAKHLNKAAVSALDISLKALQVAKQNAYQNGVSVLFKEGSILEWETLLLPTFDIVVSNPPYIPNKEKALMQANVLDYEPHLALFVEDNNALIFYERIASFALQHLNTNGKLYVECNEFNAKDVSNLFLKQGFKTVKILKDLQGKDRKVFGEV